jgi:hypothetical protein
MTLNRRGNELVPESFSGCYVAFFSPFNAQLGLRVQEMLKVTKTGDVFEDTSALNNLGIAFCEACRLEEVKMKALKSVLMQILHYSPFSYFSTYHTIEVVVIISVVFE